MPARGFAQGSLSSTVGSCIVSVVIGASNVSKTNGGERSRQRHRHIRAQRPTTPSRTRPSFIDALLRHSERSTALRPG